MSHKRAIDFGVDLGKNSKEQEKKQEDEELEEILSSVAIEQYWSERWENKSDVERAILMHNYIKEKYEINSFKLYTYTMEYLIKFDSLNGLNESLANVVAENLKEEEPMKRIDNVFLKVAENFVNEIIPEEKQEKPLMSKVFQAYQIIREVLG